MKTNFDDGVPAVLAGLHWPDAHWEELALLETCIAAPEDIAPRLIYSDWLEEHDHDAVADFIRIQCGFWVAEELDPNRLKAATSAAEDYWRPKFNGQGIACEISAEGAKFIPSLTDGHIGRHGRAFTRGLPTQVVVGIHTLHKLFQKGRERHVLCMVTELLVSCEPQETWCGVYGNYGYFGAAIKLAKVIDGLLPLSPFAGALTKLNLYGVRQPTLPNGRTQAEEPTWVQYPGRFWQGTAGVK